MSLLGRSLLDIQNLSESDVFSIFDSAKRIRHLHQTNKLDFGHLLKTHGAKYMALVFLEPSTRTRASFEVAAYKLGIQVLCPEFGSSSSLSKGESLVDTVQTMAAMDPDVIAVRHSDSEELSRYLGDSEIPIINAGSGISAHPTQALLDSFTIFESLGDVRNQKILLVGDVAHSRVARSNLKLFKILGAEVGICAPESLDGDEFSDFSKFSLTEGVEWCDAVMALRIQLERHAKTGVANSPEEYHEKYGINARILKGLGGGIVMHPGPINRGVELSEDALRDPRCRVLDQVKNGVYIRAAVLSQILGIQV